MAAKISIGTNVATISTTRCQRSLIDVSRFIEVRRAGQVLSIGFSFFLYVATATGLGGSRESVE
jgi:hypothetical protein